MEGGSFLSPLGGHHEVAALILRYLNPSDLVKLLLLNYGTREYLLSPTMNKFWFDEIQTLPRSYEVHNPIYYEPGIGYNVCQYSKLRLRLRQCMSIALSTPLYWNWTRHLKCKNPTHYHRLPSYDTYWCLYEQKPHIFQDTKNYFEIWKKKIYVKMVWWNSNEEPSDLLKRQELLLMIRGNKDPREGKFFSQEEMQCLIYEIEQFHQVRDVKLPPLRAQVCEKEEKYKNSIVKHMVKHPPWKTNYHKV